MLARRSTNLHLGLGPAFGLSWAECSNGSACRARLQRFRPHDDWVMDRRWILRRVLLLRRGHDRQDELKASAAVRDIRSRNVSAMSVDYRLANSETDAHSVFLGREEAIEDAIKVSIRYARPTISNCEDERSGFG